MDCEYYPAEALTERHRLISLLSEFLKGKRSPWDFAGFLIDYHDLLLPPPAASEKRNDSENKIFLSVEIVKIPEETDEDDFLDWVEEMEEMEQEWSGEEAEADQEGKS